MQTLFLFGFVFMLNAFPLGNILASTDIFPVEDVIACEFYVLPLIQGNNLTTSAAYYSGTGGNGPKYTVGDTIRLSGILYAYDQDAMGPDEECFFIQIIDHLPDLSQIGNDTACTYYMLPYFMTPSVSGFAGYYTQPNAEGVRFQQGDTIFSSVTLYAYDGYESCSVEKEIKIEIHDLPVFDEIPHQYGCHAYTFSPLSGENVFPDSLYFLNENQIFHIGDNTDVSGDIQVVAQNGSCITRDTFQLRVIDKISLDPPGDTLICGSRLNLPAINGINVTANAKYYKEHAGLGKDYLPEKEYTITSLPTLYAFDEIPGTDCRDEEVYNIHSIPEPRAYKDFTTTICRKGKYNVYDLLQVRNIKIYNNKIYSINNQVILETGNLFNVEAYPEGEYLFYVVDSAVLPCINDTAIMTVVVTTNCTNKDQSETYCLDPQEFEALLSTNILKDDDFVLGGYFVDENFMNILNWNQRYDLDRSTAHQLRLYYILADAFGKIDTATIVVDIVERIELGLSVSQTTLCKGECSNIKINFLDEDFYFVLAGVKSAVDQNIVNFGFFKDSVNVDEAITVCYLNTTTSIVWENPDTVYLPLSNHEYYFSVHFVDPEKECQRIPDRISLFTLEENTFYYTETLCPGESVMIEGQEFNEQRPQGEILLNTPAWNGCDSFIYVDLYFYPLAANTISEEICDTDTVIINCRAYTPEFSIDTQLLAGGGIYGCDSMIIIDLRFTKPQALHIDTVLCANQKLTIGELDFSDAGNYVGVIEKENLCDSILYDITIHQAVEEHINIQWPPFLCEGDTGIVMIDNDYETISWSTGAITNNIAVTLPGDYSVVIGDSNGCSSDTTIHIQFNEGLDIDGDFYYQGSIKEPIPFALSANSGVSFIEWQPPGGLNCSTCLSPIATLLQSQVFTFTAANNHGCIDSGTVIVEIVLDIEGDVYIPNIFNPISEPSENGKFRIFTKGGSRKYNLSIFDRWGAFIYHKQNLTSNNNSEGWDGTWNNIPLQSGAYVYKIVIEGIAKPIIGTITLLR